MVGNLNIFLQNAESHTNPINEVFQLLKSVHLWKDPLIVYHVEQISSSHHTEEATVMITNLTYYPKWREVYQPLNRFL